MDQRHGPGHSRAGTGAKLGSLVFTKTGSGFSIIELIVALTVLAIGFMGVVTLFPLGSATINESASQTVAVELAQDGLEQLMKLPYTDIELDPSFTHQDSTLVNGVEYTRQWVIQRDVPFLGCKQIVYTVIWDEADDSGRFSLKAVLGRAGRN